MPRRGLVHLRSWRGFGAAPQCSSSDLRHTGNTLAAQSGASLADLKARMGHDSDRAALIYQHATRDADGKITDALSVRVEAEKKGKIPEC
jgi:integrase